MRLIVLVTVMAAPLCLAQGPGDFKPATSNVLDAQYPRVDSNSRVQIRFKAPDAGKVRVNFWSGPKADMEKQADEYWTFTTPPMAPGLHYYTLIVDGAEVSDLGSTAYFGGSRFPESRDSSAARSTRIAKLWNSVTAMTPQRRATVSGASSRRSLGKSGIG
ncbi:MAG TPA: hypothetical protein VKU01_27780 [Bryobacteraceae bacterium]|nr:hypothetical protein [Bryobacteraceae bacterium]